MVVLFFYSDTKYLLFSRGCENEVKEQFVYILQVAGNGRVNKQNVNNQDIDVLDYITIIIRSLKMKNSAKFIISKSK